MNARLPVLLAAVALQATAACYPIWLGNSLDERVTALENASMENRAALDDTRRDLSKRIEDLQQTLDNMARHATRTSAEVAAATEELIQQLQRLQGEVAEAQFREETFRQRFEQLKRQVAALGGEEALRKYEARRGLDKIQRPADKQQFFDLAKRYYDEGEYEISRQLFDEFIRKWRYDALAPQAQLYVGDSLFAEKKYREAILAYQKIRETWPRSAQIPDALYKLGISFLELHLRNEGRQFLEEAAKFSGQEAGKQARAKLRELENRKR